MRTNVVIKGIREIWCLLLVASVLAGCRIQAGQRGKGKQVLSASVRKALAELNRGAALLEQYKYAEAARAFEAVLELAPDWTSARFNLGLAYFNMQKGRDAIGHLENAQKAFEDVLQSEPNHLHARFCLGLYYQHFGEAEKALECFEAVHQADSADTHAAYKYAEALLSLDRNEEGTRILEKIIARDPGFISAVYRLASQYQRSRQRDKARGLFARFKQLKEAELTGGSFAVLKTYGTVGKYYLALGADNIALPRFETAPSTRILFSPEIRHIDAEVSEWKCAGGGVSLAGVVAGDVDGDGDIDLCIAGLGPNGSTSLWLNDGAGEFLRGATLAQRGISPCLGDMDNDGDIDLWLGCAGPDLYFENDGKGNFSENEAAKVGGGQLVTACARLLDIDSDGDLDALACRLRAGTIPATGALKPAASSLYNNNRDGSFADIAERLGLALEKTPISAVGWMSLRISQRASF